MTEKIWIVCQTVSLNPSYNSEEVEPVDDAFRAAFKTREAAVKWLKAKMKEAKKDEAEEIELRRGILTINRDGNTEQYCIEQIELIK